MKKNDLLFYLLALNVFCTIAFANSGASAGALQIILIFITKVVLVFSFFVGLFFYCSKKEYLVPIDIFLILPFFVICLFLSIFVNYGFVFSSFIVSTLLYILYSLSMSSERDFAMIINFSIFGGYGLVLYLIYSFNGIFGLVIYMRSSVLENMIVQKNILSYNMAIVVLMCTYKFLYEKKKIYLALIVLPILISLGTGSRRGIISIFVAIVFLLLLRNFNYKIILNIFIVILGLYITYFLLKKANTGYLITRIESLFSLFLNRSNASSSDMVRMDMISKGLEMIKLKPILGYGAGAFKGLSGFGIYSHNNYIELLVNYGIIGLLSYYIIFVVFLIKLFRIAKTGYSYAKLLIAFIIMRLVSDFGNVSYYDRYTYIMLGVCLSYCLYIKRSRAYGK